MLRITTEIIHLFRKPRAEEGHVISVGVWVDRAERIRADCSQKSKNASGELRANYTKQSCYIKKDIEESLGIAISLFFL